jgi:hypothetical protein
LNIRAFPKSRKELFAYQYFDFNKVLEEKWKGWKMYDIEKEMRRQQGQNNIIKALFAKEETKNIFYKFVDNSQG